MSKKKARLRASAAVPTAGSALRYVGDGAWVRGVPARDLSSVEVAALGIDAVALCQARPDLYTEAASAVAADEQSADSGKETF